MTCTVQYLTNERILTDIETAISKDYMNMTNKKNPMVNLNSELIPGVTYMTNTNLSDYI